MKPCPHHQRDLTLLAARSLPDHEATALHRHVDTCRACREYLTTLEKLCRTMEQPSAALSTLALPPRFEESLRRRLAASGSAGIVSRMRENLGSIFHLPRWARIAGASAMVAAVAFLLIHRHDANPPGLPAPKTHTAISPTAPAPIPRAPSFTLLAYHQALQASPAALETLVLQQSKRVKAGDGMFLFAERGPSL